MNTNMNNADAFEEFVLAPQSEAAEQVVDNTKNNTKKYSFLVEYSSPEKKENLLEQLKEFNCVPEMHLDFINCVSVSVTMETLAKIKKCDSVRRVERNYEFTLLSAEETNSSSEMTEKTETAQNEAMKPMSKIEKVHAQNIKGQKIKIAILDTGIAPHPDFTIAGGISFVGSQYCYEDTHGHGTQMAGIIAASGVNNPVVKGTAPSAEIYAVKVFNDKGLANTAAVIAGIHWAMEHKIKIINMSFGTYFKSKLLQKVINMAAVKGLILVAAAGNEGTFKENRLKYPAAYRNVLAVGSGSASGVAFFSNQSEKLDFVTSGRMNTTTLDGKYTHIVGTSASAAYVTGELATLWSAKSRYQAKKVLNAAKASGTVSENASGFVGYGELDPDGALTNFSAYSTMSVEKATAENSSVSVVAEEPSLVLATPVAAASETASLFCWSGGDSSDCEEDTGSDTSTEVVSNSNTKETAHMLYLSSREFQTFVCPDDEIWFKFIASDTSAHINGTLGRYIIRSYGSLDTIGYLYDTDGTTVLRAVDDNGTNLNFYIDEELDYGKTYYVKVVTHNETGDFEIGVEAVPAETEEDTGSGSGSNTGSDCSDGNSDCGSGSGSGSSSNTIEMAYELQPFVWYSNQINQACDEVWFKFTTNNDDAHPCRGLGRYNIYTSGDLDTVGTLYNSAGIELISNDDCDGDINFNLSCLLPCGNTYFVKIKAFDTLTGSFDIRVTYELDDHGNSFDTATDVNAVAGSNVYYEDCSINGHLHANNDIDYFSFTPLRNCVLEIYTESSIDTYGRLYDESGLCVAQNDNGNGNGNFKITTKVYGNKKYILGINHGGTVSANDYVLKVRFVKDFWNGFDTSHATSNETVFENLDILHQLAKEYDASNDMKLVLQFIRRLEYNNGNWAVVAGEINQDFVDYVKQNNRSIYDFFSQTNLIVYDKEQGPIDFIHLCATMNGIIVGGGTYWKSLVVGKTHVRNLAGWAGDLQTLVVDTYQLTNATSDYDIFYSKFYQIMGDENYSFSMPDLLADIDAWNFADNWISAYWQSNLFGSACRYYYNNDDIPGTGWTSRSNLRFTQFIGPETKTNFSHIASYYTDQYWALGIEWPIYESRASELGITLKLTSTQSNAARDAFIDYIWLLYEYE